MKSYSQYIIHRQKVPSDYRTGQPANAHDPAVWTDHETAARAAAFFGVGYGVGFVFTDTDPHWFLDIDKCRVGEGWSQTALDLCALFAGCYIEVSQSNSGLHIVGTGTVPEHACRNSELGLEFYTSGRYMALGHNAIGDPNHDASALMPAFVAKYFQHESTEVDAGWREGHELGWELPDDDELIQRAMRMGGASVVFGGRASFADLWEARETELTKHYPDASGQRAFDASSADMALASKLAWLTGNDCPRIESLMRRSGLVRDKWDKHPTYLAGFTIPRALVRDGSFYDPRYRERRREQMEENIRIGEGSDSLPASGSMGADEMVKRYAYIIEGKRVIDLEQPRRIFTLDEWKSAHKSSKSFAEVKGEYKMDGSPKVKMSPNTNLWEEHDGRLKIDTVTFRPGHPLQTIDPDGKGAVNMWRDIVRKSAPAGDVGVFTHHIEYLFGADAPRFLDWLAHIEQRPGDLPHTGWVHISPMHGTGRNWLTSLFVNIWRGHVAASFDLAGTLKNGYNGNLSMKLLAIVDEINEGGSAARWENAEVLKSIVTPAYRPINPKFGYQRMEYNCARWLIFSNHVSALPLAEGDRRFNVVSNNYPPMPEGYYKQLYGALSDRGFIEAVAWFLKSRDIAGFNPGAHAVLNEAKRDLIGASRTEADDVLQELIESHPADIIANSTLAGLLTGQPFGAKLNAHHRHTMQRYGVTPYGKSVRMGTAVIKVSIIRNHVKWKNADVDLIKFEMARNL